MTKQSEFYEDVVLFSNEDPEDIEETTSQESEIELDPESWQDWHSQDLLNMYMSLVEYCETTEFNFMKNITYESFCTFISSYSK